MGDWWLICDRNVITFTAMAFAESTIVVMHTLYKAANLKGLNFFVYITYTYTLGTLLLLVPTLSFILISRRRLPRFKLSILCKILLLSVMGFVGRTCMGKAIEYSSPAMASSINTLSPGITFILALIFRMEDLELKSSTTLAKIIGTVISICGALIMILYKGITILSYSSSSSSSSISLATPHPNWVIGGLLVMVDKILVCSSYILLNHVLKVYPSNKLIVTFIYSLGIAIIAIPTSFVITHDLNAWKLRPDITLVSIMYPVFFGPNLIMMIHSYCLPLKGPLYVSIFTPFSIILATTASVVFLGEDMYIGSVIGAAILLVGFYCVLWGKIKEVKSKLGDNSMTPLLDGHV